MFGAISVDTISDSTPLRRGFSFALHLLRVQGFYFCPAAIQPYTSVYSAFCAIHAVIQPTPQNSAQGFTEAFPAICRIFSLLCGGVSSYTAPPATRWSISQRRNTSNAYQIPAATPDAIRVSKAAYYNKVYKGATVCPVMDPCQTVQQIADRASPAGSASPPVQSQPGGFQSGTGSAVRACRVGLAHSTRRGSPAAGVRRAARNH